MNLLSRRFPFLLLVALFQNAAAVITNYTIDDTLGDAVTGVRPVYLPSTGAWDNVACPMCAIQPDPSFAFGRSWTAATYSPKISNMSIQLNFKGTAIYVFFILANYAGAGITTETDCDFTLDGASRGKFVHIPSNSSDLQYNQLVFSATTLPNDNHMLLISTSGLDHNVFVNFDYAVYTVPDSNATTNPGTTASASLTGTADSSKTSLPSAAISKRSGSLMAGVVAGIVALIVPVVVSVL